MALNDILKQGVEIANAQTKSLQVEVQRYAVLTKTPFGEVTHETVPRKEKVLWDKTQKVVRSLNGTLVNASGTLTYLQPVSIDPLDKIVLPDGTNPPILSFGGLVNPSTVKPFVTEVYLG